MSCRQVPQECTGPGRPAHCPGSSAAAAVPSGKKRGWGRLGRGWEGWGRGVRVGGPRSESSRPPLPPRSHHYQSPTPPPPRARAQASTPRACRVSRSHTPRPCYPPSHHLTLPTPSNYKSCQGAPLPGRASHRAPARTTLQPHCPLPYTPPPHQPPPPVRSRAACWE